MALNNDQEFQVLMAQMQERNHAWHEMRARSMQFALWILGLAIAASWHLLQNPCDGWGQRIAVTVLTVVLAGGSIHFLAAVSRGVRSNRKALISVERRLGLHQSTDPVLPAEYTSTKTRWSAHFVTLYGLIVVTALYLLAAIWFPACASDPTSSKRPSQQQISRR